MGISHSLLYKYVFIPYSHVYRIYGSLAKISSIRSHIYITHTCSPPPRLEIDPLKTDALMEHVSSSLLLLVLELFFLFKICKTATVRNTHESRTFLLAVKSLVRALISTVGIIIVTYSETLGSEIMVSEVVHVQ